MYNPNSGRGKIGRQVGKIEGRLREIFGEVAVFAAESAEDMTARARFWASRNAVIVFAGGDGTFNAVLAGAIGENAALGYIPAGTCNDAARSLRLPRTVKGALRTIARGRTAQVDCMAINEKRYAFCIVAAGSVTRLTYSTPQGGKRRLGWLAYALGFLKNIVRGKPFYAEAECGGKRVRGNFALALVMNGRRVARMPVNRGASMADGVCETALVRQFGSGIAADWGARWGIVRLMLFGAKRGGKRIVRLRGDAVNVRKTHSVLWDFDGEPGEKGEIDVRVLPGAVKVFVP